VASTDVERVRRTIDREAPATPQVESGPQDEPGRQSETPIALGESQPPEWRLREGTYTGDARNRVAELASPDGRIAAEAQRALTRLGRDAVPALVEALDGERHSWRTKQRASPQ
jgi:hypothetical protein